MATKTRKTKNISLHRVCKFEKPDRNVTARLYQCLNHPHLYMMRVIIGGATKRYVIDSHNEMARRCSNLSECYATLREFADNGGSIMNINNLYL